MSLTIKQAFEALSDACANGMKNPFFVMRRLKESFADVASKVVDASGDKVTVTQTLTEGTEIGSIKVNNNTTTLYAPASSGGGVAWTLLKSGKGNSGYVTLPATFNELLCVASRGKIDTDNHQIISGVIPYEMFSLAGNSIFSWAIGCYPRAASGEDMRMTFIRYSDGKIGTGSCYVGGTDYTNDTYHYIYYR